MKVLLHHLPHWAMGLILLGMATMTSPAWSEELADPPVATALSTSGSQLGAIPMTPEGGINTSAAESNPADSARSEMLPFSLNYYAVMFGPSLQNPSRYQPSPTGGPDLTRPVILKNFLSFSYGLSEQFALSATAYAVWAPALKQQLLLQDPFLMISDNSWFHLGNLNLYGDLRFHLPVTGVSQANNLMMGVQTFQVLTYGFDGSRFTLGVNGSLRTNFYGGKGWGNDLELYLAPNLRYQMSPRLAFTLLYELQGSHFHGNSPGIVSDGTDLQPGVVWDILPSLSVNPFLNLQTGGAVNLKTTSMGFFMSWGLI